jgi:hypothetical protein
VQRTATLTPAFLKGVCLIEGDLEIIHGKITHDFLLSA